MIRPLLLSMALSWSAAAESELRFVKLIDVGGFADSQSTPGADIDAIEVVRNGEVIATASRVLETSLLDGYHGNLAKDPQQSLGPPDHRPRTLDFTALGGPGGFIVLELSAGARVGDVLRVYEIGGSSGREEHVEVCVSHSPVGPFRPVGHGWGQFDSTITAVVPESTLDHQSRCIAPSNT